jgi:hypothetical protein
MWFEVISYKITLLYISPKRKIVDDDDETSAAVKINPPAKRLRKPTEKKRQMLEEEAHKVLQQAENASIRDGKRDKGNFIESSEEEDSEDNDSLIDRDGREEAMSDLGKKHPSSKKHEHLQPPCRLHRH